MSDAGIRDRDSRIVWARPGSSHDRLIHWAGIVLPSAVGALAAVLMIAPMLNRSEVSFLLAKDKVAIARERMRAAQALYRGEDARGRPFSLSAGSAVQRTSRVPVVEMNDLAARLTLDTGPATLRTATAQYNMDRDTVVAPAGVLLESADGYRLTTRNVLVDLKSNTMQSRAPVEGRMPLGNFSANDMRADINARTVVLEGRARLHIVQGGARAR